MTLQDGEDGDKKAELAQRVGQQRWGRETERRCAPPQPNGPKNCNAQGRGPDGTLMDLRPQRRNASVRSGKGVRGTGRVQRQVSVITPNCVSAKIELCKSASLEWTRPTTECIVVGSPTGESAVLVTRCPRMRRPGHRPAGVRPGDI